MNSRLEYELKNWFNTTSHEMGKEEFDSLLRIIESHSNWIDIDKEQPPIGKNVLTVNAYERQIVQPRYYVERNLTNGSYFLGECKRTGLVTHWQYTPPSPKRK